MVVKNNLWIFGSSISCPYTHNDVKHFGLAYCNYKGYIPKIYSEIISEKLNYNHLNYSVGGSDNYSIFESICEHSHAIQSNDIIIVNWASYYRYRLVQSINENEYGWAQLLPISVPYSFRKYGESFFRDQHVLREDSGLPKIEISNWMNLLNSKFKDMIYYWSPFDLNQDTILLPDDFFLTSTISTDTNNIIDDNHYDERTHKLLANLFIKDIIKKLNIKKTLS